MKPHQHHALRERDVFTTACELDNPAEYLASIAVTDPALAERVRRLLDARNAADSLLDLPGVLRTEPQLGADSTRSPTSDSPFIDSTPYWSVSGQETAKHEPLGPVPGFEIETVLGRGGMSIVYKARQVALKRTVALKMMLAGVHATPSQRTRFRFEAEAVARLQHPNIVQIHEVGETTGFPYCALEYVEGGTLAEKLGGNPLPILDAAMLVETLARAMQLAHSRNIIHRDLKPANILLTADGVPKITDFGLARQLDGDTGVTMTGVVMGTPSYMAPEQASGQAHEAGPATDVYALGAILYECITGRAPFKGSSITEILDCVRSQEPVPPSRLAPDVPLDLETICLKCLRKEPEKRYASASELAEELARFQRGEPIFARPISRAERMVKWVKRNPSLAMALGMIAFVLLGVTVASLVVARQFREMAEKQTDLAEKEKASRLVAENVSDASRRNLYHAEMTLAMRLLGLPNSIDRVKAHVDSWAHKPDTTDLFGWEWRLAQNLAQPRTKSQWWQHGAQALECSPDGRTLVVGSHGLVLLDSQEMKVLKQWNCANDVNQLRWEPAGHRLAISSTNRIILFDTHTETTLWQHPASISPRMIWDPLRRWVAYLDQNSTCRIANPKTGEAIYSISEVGEAIAFSPDGQYFATLVPTPTRSHDIRIWRTSDWTIEKNIQYGSDIISAMMWSPQSKYLACGTAIGEVILINPKTGNRIHSLEANGVACQSLAWQVDAQWLAVHHLDGSIRVWECSTWAEVPLCREPNPVAKSICWHPDETKLAAGCADSFVRSWSMDQPRAYWTFHFGSRLANTSYLSCAWHPNSQSLAGSGAAPGTIVWSVDGRRQYRLNAVEWQWTSDGKYSASVVGEQVTVWDPDGRTVATVELRGQPKVLAWQPQTHTLAIRTANRIHLWKPTTGQPPEQILGEPAPRVLDFVHGNRMAWSPDGTRLAFGERTENQNWSPRVGILSVADRTVIQTLAEGTTPIEAIAYSPDGQKIAIGRGEPKVRIYDATLGREVQELGGHGAAIRSIAWHPTDNRIATGSSDGATKVWDSERWRPTVTFELGSVVRHVAWSPDGATLAAAAESGTIHVWNCLPRPNE